MKAKEKKLVVDILKNIDKQIERDRDAMLQREINGLKQEIAKLDISFEDTLILDRDMFATMYTEQIQKLRGFNIQYIEGCFDLLDCKAPITTKSNYIKLITPRLNGKLNQGYIYRCFYENGWMQKLNPQQDIIYS